MANDEKIIMTKRESAAVHSALKLTDIISVLHLT